MAHILRKYKFQCLYAKLMSVCYIMVYSRYENKCHITTIPLNVEFVQNIVNKFNYIYFTKLLPVIFEKN